MDIKIFESIGIGTDVIVIILIALVIFQFI